MASISIPIKFSTKSSRLISSLYLSPNRVSLNHVMLKRPSSRVSCLAFSPFLEIQKSPAAARVELTGKALRFSGFSQPLRRRGYVELLAPAAAAAAADTDADGIENDLSKGFAQLLSFSQKFLIAGFFFFAWFFFKVISNILNKQVYNYFPYPYFVSVVHLLVGVVYCLVSWAIGLPKRAPLDKEILLLLTPVAFYHALGHVISNVSFAAIAVSLTHTIKALEPFYKAAASQIILGHQIPLSLWLSLAPVVIGVSMASLTEISFNWLGFGSAMISNIAFTYRSIYSKKAMTGMDSTNVYTYISIIALLVCIPPAVLIEGPKLMQYGFADAIARAGVYKFLSDLFWIGISYHLYNQIATNTLERVAPLTHVVGNVLILFCSIKIYFI